MSEELKRRGGRLIVVSVDTPEESLALRQRRGLNHHLLSDEDRSVLRMYDLLHAGGGPGGSDIAVPAHLLINQKGRIVWRHVAGLIQDRPDPAEILEQIARLDPAA